LDDRTSHERDLQLHSIAHGVIQMEKMPREYGTIRRRIVIPKVRGMAFREGFHDYMIRKGGVVVFPAMCWAMKAATRGERSALFLFEETVDSALTRCRGLGLQIDPYLASGLIKVRRVDPAELSPGQFTDQIRRWSSVRE
jgi:circadian clock protein KaiC